MARGPNYYYHYYYYKLVTANGQKIQYNKL